MDVTRHQILALLTAHPDTWELTAVPDWLAEQCAELGLITRTASGAWKLTATGYGERRSRLGEA
jgi:hypothetical protein